MTEGGVWVTQAVLNDTNEGQPVDVAVIRAARPDAEGESDAARQARLTRVWAAWLGVAVLFVVGQVLAGAPSVVGDLFGLVMPLLFTAGIVTGAMLNRPKQRWPWLMLASAGVITVVGMVIWWTGATMLAFAVFLAVYPVEAMALLVIVRGTSWRRDRAGLIDTSMISVGLALACWLLVITPLMRVRHALPGEALSALLPFGDVLLLGVLIRFFTSRGLRNAAFWQISAALLLQTAGHLATLLLVVFAVDAPSLRPLTSLSALLLAGAALHPSMRHLTGQPLPSMTEISPLRVTLVNSVCMSAPALLLAQGALQHGKVDWIAAGVGCMILFSLATLRMVDLVGQVQDKARQLDAVAHIDALTTLPNRRAWDLELHRRIAAARRHGSPVVAAIIDLDHFKRYNDEHGHQGGDVLLTHAAAAWRTELRPEDLLARYGGEEFGIILDHARLADADRIIERLQLATPLGQTFSGGAAQWNGTETAEELLARADTALYAAKRAGRDRLYVSPTH